MGPPARADEEGGQNPAYHVTWEQPTLLADLPGAYRGNNDRQGFRAYFTPVGVRAVPTPGSKFSWEWDLTLAAYGYAGAEESAGPANHSVVTNRIDFGRSGDLAERFVNDPAALDHLLTVASPAVRAEDGTPFHLDFTLGGTLVPKRTESTDTLAFLGPDGWEILRYADLGVIDAEGREVPSRFELTDGGGIRIVVEDASATYPLTVHAAVVSSLSAIAVGEPAAPEAAPANDMCGGAQPIPSAGPFPYLTATVDLADATEIGDPAPTCAVSGLWSRGVWYTFTPAATNTYTLTTCKNQAPGTTRSDTVLAVFTSSTGDCTGTLTQIGCNDDDSGCSGFTLHSTVALTLNAGTPYFILAYSWSTTAPPAGASDVQIRISAAPPGPANDTCGGAVVVPSAGPFPHLTGFTDVLNATTVGDPPAPSCQTNVSRGVWYEFTPAATGSYGFETCVPPTGTTLSDTVISVHTSSDGTCAGTMTQVPGGCDDDGCAGLKSTVTLNLTAGVRYFILVWKFAATAPPATASSVQLNVSSNVAPENDTCASPTALALDRPRLGVLNLLTVNDFQLSGSTCFTGIGQTASTAAGRDVVYSFTAPTAGLYSFRVTGHTTSRNLVLYTASTCPVSTGPHTVSSCISAANRSASSTAEEVMCQSMAAGETVYAFVDQAAAATASDSFVIEANRCVREVEGNGTPATANSLVCGIEGTIAPAGDVDFYSIGSPPGGHRVYSMADGVAGNSTDFDLRVTTTTDTLEYDDLDNDVPFGSLAPNVGGAPLTGTPAYIRMNHFSATTQAEPYRLYTVVQPPLLGATLESEPNGTIAAANASANDYFRGALAGPAPSTDADFYRFHAAVGDLIVLGLDGDPTRDNTPINPRLDLFDAAGNLLVGVNDGASTSSTTSGAGSLTATTPRSPGEALTWRARRSGSYYARVSIGTTSTGTTGAGDYALSIAVNCLAAAEADLALSKTASPNPVSVGSNLTYSLTVTNLGPSGAGSITLYDSTPSDTTFVSVTAPSGWDCSTPSVGGTGAITCTSDGSVGLAVGDSASFTIVVKVDFCVADGSTISNGASVTSGTRDTNASNDTASAPVTVSNTIVCDDGNVCTDDGCAPQSGCFFVNNTAACDDGNACTTADTCSGGTCVGGPPPNCDDGNVCTDDSCDTAVGCVYANNTNPCDDGNLCTTGDSCSNGVCVGVNTALNEPNPRTNGYYKRLCHGPHSGDQLTDADAACVASITTTFAGISTVAEVCAVIQPSQPNNDKCRQTEDDLMVLALNRCKVRVCDTQAIRSQCGSNSTVGQSFAQADSILSSPSRNFATCSHAKCLTEEINTGRALEMNSLTLNKTAQGGTILNWKKPYVNDGGPVNQYKVWRRPLGSSAAFVRIATVNNGGLTYTDPTTGNFEYEVTANGQ